MIIFLKICSKHQAEVLLVLKCKTHFLAVVEGIFGLKDRREDNTSSFTRVYRKLENKVKNLCGSTVQCQMSINMAEIQDCNKLLLISDIWLGQNCSGKDIVRQLAGFVSMPPDW